MNGKALATFVGLWLLVVGVGVGLGMEQGVPKAQAATSATALKEFPLFNTHPTAHDEIIGISFLVSDDYGKKYDLDAWVPIYSVDVRTRNDDAYMVTIVFDPPPKRNSFQQYFERAIILVPQEQYTQWRARIWNLRVALKPWNHQEDFLKQGGEK